MKFLMHCNCGHCFPPEPVGCVFNHPVVMCCLIWAVVVVFLGIVIVCLLCKKAKMAKEAADNERKHELDLKEKAFKQEKFWAIFNRMDKPVKDELEKARKELDELKKKEKELDEGKSALKKEKEESEKQILEEKIKVYQEIIKNTK